MTSIYTRNAITFRRALMSGAAITAFAAMPQVAFAQSQDEAQIDAEEANEFREGEILVQARRQTESLQEVPVTVTVISGELLEDYNINDVSDVTARVPGLTVQVGGSGSGGSVTLRGVGSAAISAAFDQAVATDVDGVQFSNGRFLQAGFFDVEQIDILKGPQSLFFGKSASAGVISLRSANPTSTFEIGGRAGYEFEEEGYIGEAYISGPLTDTLGFRLAGSYSQIDEAVESQPNTPLTIQPRGFTDYIVRGTLAWDPAPGFRVNAKLSYTRNENDGSNFWVDQFCGVDGVADPVIFAFGNAVIQNNADCNIRDEFFPQVDSDPTTLAGVAPPTNRSADLFLENNGLAFGLTEIYFARLAFEADLTDSITLYSTSGYVDSDSVDRDAFSYVGVGPAVPLNPAAPLAPGVAAVNGDNVAFGLGSNLANNVLQQFTQEFRLASDFGGPFDFQAGVFYETRETLFSTAEQAFNVPLAFGLATGGGIGFDYQRDHRTIGEAISLFGSVDYDVTERLNITAGLRWTTENKQNTIQIPFINPIIAGLDLDGDGVSNFVSSGFVSAPINFSDDQFSPEVSVTYNVTDDINVFAAFKTGFKSGGIDTSALPGVGLAGIGNQDINPDTGNTFDADATEGLLFDSETSTGGEIGIKSQFMNRALTLNLTGYYYVFDDLQVQLFDGVAVQFITLNAGQQTTSGFDLDWNYRTPLDGLTMFGTVGYLDSRFTDTFFAQPGNDLDGRDASRSPDLSGNVGFDYSLPLGDSLDLGFGGNAFFTTSYLTGNNFEPDAPAPDVRQSGFVTLDGRVSIGAPGGQWTLALVGTNLTDKIFIQQSGPRPFLPPGGDDRVVLLNRGRQVTAEVSFKF